MTVDGKYVTFNNKSPDPHDLSSSRLKYPLKVRAKRIKPIWRKGRKEMTIMSDYVSPSHFDQTERSPETFSTLHEDDSNISLTSLNNIPTNSS